MSTRLAAAMVLVLTAAGGSSSTSAPSQESSSSADHQANITLVHTWTQRFLARDFEGLLTLYTEDAVMMPPNEPEVTGRTRIRTWFDGAPSISSYVPKIDQVEVRGDLAVVRGTYSMTFTPKGATSPSQDNGKWLEVRKKQADGSWKIATDIFNSSMPSS